MFDNFIENISKWNVIVGLIIVILGFVLMLAAKTIAKKAVPDKEGEKMTEKRDKLTLLLKVIAGVAAIVGCVMVMFIGM